ncbi:ankyrin repeat domain-containing protein [Wolbachia endosymbiont (group A) of Cheilosia soror]|uniref:ankyrin repeat domain-containing protein n=1 Tax=Wolbachia endosymbiont (group A) of Cheilosia soror TaxID=2953995 RepID=UPI0022275405|nr:ankyrin repeat domain-containing protein [Wolbachia endosymbiont (group A) of Cheilosia soror]
MVLIPEGTEKLVYVINVIEADGRAEVLSKGVPLNNLNEKIGNRKIAELNLNFNIKQKSNFKKHFSIEANEPISLEQYNNKKANKFQGTFENVPYPDQLKETFDRVLDSQLTSAQSSSIDEYNGLFRKIGEGMLPFKTLINKETNFQGVLDGALSHYSDLRLQESPETRALVLTEFQTGRGKRVDMLVHGIKFADQGNAKEYTPIGLELKGPEEKISADKLKEKANKQITERYAKGVTYKTLTDGDEVKFIGVVFDKKASNANSLVLASRTSEEGFIPVKVVHSSVLKFSLGPEDILEDSMDLFNQRCNGSRKKRNIGMACIDSRDEESIEEKEKKERRIKELFDTDEIRERTKSIEFYDQLFKVSEHISKGEAIDQNIEEAFIAKVKDIDLNSIDPEIRDVMEEIKEKISEKEANKSEKIKDILRRSGVEEKISEAAKGVGLTYRKFLDEGGSESQNIINKINSSPEAMSHLNRVGRISGWAMEGMMYKNLIGDILSGNLEGVAINLGFIGGSHLLGKVANTVAIKGEQFISEGKVFLGKSLKVASPFLARATSAFIAYDLANQVKAFKSGDKNAMAGIVGDSIALTVDAAAIGIEVAEVAGILSGVSSVTGPIGAGITALVFIGTDIYLSVKAVEQEDKIIHLTGWEKFKEGWRAFLHIKPEEYIEKLIKEKQANSHLVENAVGFLKQHTGIRRYVFPTGKLIFREFMYVDRDNKVLLNEKIGDIKWSRSRPDNPRDGELFCLPEGDWESVPRGGAYLCENAIGLSYSTNRTGDYTLTDLGEGDDEVIGFQDSPNIFLAGDGNKNFTGGSKDDFFILQGNGYSSGIINGGRGSDTLDLTKFALGYSIKIMRTFFGYFSISSDGKNTCSSFKLMNIQTILGREKEQDEVQCSSDLKYVDGGGGKDNNHPDKIFINHVTGSGKLTIAVRPNTEIINRSYNGNFSYIAFHGEGRANININRQTDKLQHSFLFNYALPDLKNVKVHDLPGKNTNYPIKDVKFNFQQSPLGVFDIDIKNVANNASYVLTDDKTEVKIGNGGSLYLLQNTNKPIDEIVRNYPAIANRLSATVFAKFQDELVVIGHGKHEVMSNDPLHKSHLVGNGGENVYVITPTQKEVSIYDVSKESSIDTLDLRNTVKDMKDIQFSSLNVSQDKDDLLIKLEMERSPLKFPIRLKNGVQWYQKLHVVLNINMQLERNGNNWILSPLPLIFDENTKTIVITAKDIEEGNKLIVHKQAGHYTFLRLRDDLVIITDSSTGENNICTILLSNFYREPKMETLSIEFNDTTISIQEKMNEINSSKLLFCSSALQVNEPFSIDVRELLNNHDCLKFDSDKIAFFRSSDNLLLLSDQGVSVILNYYSHVHRQWNLPIELNNSIIKPEEFREKADDPSSFRYYLPGEEGLKIYHNQPTDKYQVGLVDLKNRSILDCDMRIVDKNFILSSGNNTIVKVENWVTGQKIMFAFNDAIVFNPKCIFVACNQEDIIEEFNQEKNRVSSIPQIAALVSGLPLDEAVEKDNLDSVNTLHHAVITNNYAMAQLLISEGTDIEARDNDGKTPLSRAVSLDKPDMVQLLLNKGADIEAEDNDGRTPLSRAVTLGNLNMVQLLLNKGAYIYSKDGNGKTIFEIAHECHKAEIVNYLITKQDKYGNTILHYAAEEGNLNLVELLLDNNTHISVKNSDGWIPLHLAVKEGKLDVVELLMRKGANIDAKDNNNQTPLHIAVQVGNFDTISLIVDKIESIKFLINEKDEFGYTPLQYAAKNGKWDIVNLFLDKTAERGPDDVTNKDQLSKSWTTVHYAVYNGDLHLIKDIFQFLQDKDAIVNTKDSSDWTPLHYAVYYNALDTVKFLVSKGADIESRDRDGKTPLDISIDRKYDGVVQYLKQVQLNEQLLKAVQVGDRNEVKALISRKADVSAKDKDGKTPLHYASWLDSSNMVKDLIREGANIDAKDNNGKTPLEDTGFNAGVKRILMQAHLDKELLITVQGNDLEKIKSLVAQDVSKDSHGAYYYAWSGNLDTVKFLVEGDVNVNATDKYDCTLLHWAALKGHLEVAKFLVNKRANVNAEDIFGRSPMHFAVMNNHIGVLRYLVTNQANIDAKDNNGKTPLEVAREYFKLEAAGILSINKDIKEGKLDEVKHFLANNASRSDTDAKDKDKWSKDWNLLHYAVYNGNLNLFKGVFELLLEKSGSINAGDQYGWTPLHYAVYYNEPDIVSFLVDKKADIDAQAKDHKTPLHVAAQYNSGSEITGLLLDKDANIEATVNNGFTVLHEAVYYNKLGIVEFLVQRDADINAKNGKGETPLEVANRLGRSEIANFLRGKQNEKPVQRKRRHHHGDHPRHYDRSSRKLPATDLSNQPEVAARQDVPENSLQNDETGYNKGGATSGASKPSSWINVAAHAVADTVMGVFQFISSPFKSAIDMEHSQPSKAITTQGTDVNSTLFLLDVFIRKITGQKYISTVDQPTISLPEAEYYASDIINEFEQVLKKTAVESGISVTNLNFDPIKPQSDIVGQLINGNFSEISKTLYSSAKQACPEFKQTKKFLERMKSHIEELLDKKELVLTKQQMEQSSKASDQQASGATELSKKPFLKGTSVAKGLELCSGGASFVANNPTGSQLPGATSGTDGKPESYLSGVTVDNQLERSQRR